MLMDIRDYLPPSLKHVMVYTSEAEREKRKEAAREAFGHPTPVPRAPEPSLKPGDADEGTPKVQPASPWSAGAKGEVDVDEEALPSARVPPSAGGVAPVKVIPLRVVVRATLAAVVVSAVVVAWKWRAHEPHGVSTSPAATATPSAAAMPSATAFVLGVAPAVSTGASAAPSVTSTAAPSAMATATPSAKVVPKPDPDDPYAEQPRRKSKGSRLPAIDAGVTPGSKEPVITE